MSKFFDQTVRARKTTTPLEAVNFSGVHQSFLESTPAVQLPVSGLGSSRLEHCRKSSLLLSTFLQGQFKGSDTVEPAEESYRALRTRLLRAKASQGLRSVVITSAATSEGKTLTSLNLAICCAHLHDMQILLIDGDIRSRGLSRLLGNPPAPGLAEVLEGKSEPEKAVLSTDLANLYVLPAGSTNVPAPELFAGHRWQELIGWSSESFKLILVDSPPVLNLSDTELIGAACDGVLMVVRALHTPREILTKAAQQIDSKKLLGIVYNAVEDGSHHDYHYWA